MRFIKLIIIFSLVIKSACTFSQTDSIVEDFFSINPNIGAASNLHEELGTIMGCAINYQHNKLFISVAYQYFEKLELFADKGDVLNDLSIMAGTRLGKKYFRFDLQAGIGNISTEYFEYDDHIFKNTARTSLMLKTGFRYVPWEFFAVGADIRANINTIFSYCSLTLNLEFGKIK